MNLKLTNTHFKIVSCLVYLGYSMFLIFLLNVPEFLILNWLSISFVIYVMHYKLYFRYYFPSEDSDSISSARSLILLVTYFFLPAYIIIHALMKPHIIADYSDEIKIRIPTVPQSCSGCGSKPELDAQFCVECGTGFL
ncbi:MAG: hypothetical protein ACFFCQ_12520 [Promethearchaeota archaeon]